MEFYPYLFENLTTNSMKL
jgi:hypothetical protein